MKRVEVLKTGEEITLWWSEELKTWVTIPEDD